MKKVIVTGATSYIAIALINKLIQEEYMVYAIIRPNSSNKEKLPKNRNIKVIELSLIEIEKIAELRIRNIEAIYHFAWEGVRGEARNNNKLQLQNYETTQKCIDASIKLQIPCFIGIGSQAEYVVTDQVITEKTALCPTSEYGKYKVKSYIYGMKKSNMINFVWARIFSAYGKNENPNTLLMQCISKMKKNDVIDLSPCEHMWDYTYIDDVADALFLLMSKRVDSGAYNISYGQAQKLKEYVLQIRDILHSESILNFGAFPYHCNELIQINPDVSKLKEITGWKPKIDFKTGIKKIIEGLDTNEKS